MRRSVGGWSLIVIAAVGAAAVSTVAKSLPAFIASVAAAVAGAVAAVLSSRGTAALAEERQRLRHTQRDLLTDSRNRLPRVRDVNDLVLIGVHRAVEPRAGTSDSRMPAFVRRDQTSEMEDAVRHGGFVLVVGDSTAGKSRAAFEAIRASVPDHVFLCPTTRAGVG